MNLVTSIVLTGASIAPVLFVYAVVGFFEGERLPSALLAVAGFILVILGLGLLVCIKKRLERMQFSFSSVEVADRESIGLLVVYLVPLLRTSFSDLEYLVLVPCSCHLFGLGYNWSQLPFQPTAQAVPLEFLQGWYLRGNYVPSHH